MKKLVCTSLALCLLLAGCGGGDKKAEETPTPNQLQRLELTAEEDALLNLVGGTEAEYGLYQCAAGEGVTGYTIEVLSWSDGSWETLAEGGLSALQSDALRLGIVLSGDKITVNFQDGGARYSYAPQIQDMDRNLDTGRSWVWLEDSQILTVGERTPLYLEVYDNGSGIRSATLPDTFSDAGQLNSYDRAYAVAITAQP